MLRYAAPIFLGAFLLFQVQPLIARCILPWFGGTPSVWTTCMLFFQVMLLLGYAYAHLVVSRFTRGTQTLVHAALLAASLGLLVAMVVAWGRPLIPPAAFRPEANALPVWQIVRILVVAVGLPYFMLATTSPLLQAWFTQTHQGISPYRLYTLSNAGSLLALLSYPFIVEPALALKTQATVWSWTYVAFVLSYGYCAFCMWSTAAPAAAPAGSAGPDEQSAPPAWWHRLLWLSLPALASILLLAATNEICQEVAVIPFLWVLPLSLYLLSFIICFDHKRWYARGLWVTALILAVPLAIAVSKRQLTLGLPAEIGVYALVLFLCCMVCHGELVALKPSPRHLTSFYLAVATGGAIGGLFVTLIAPRLGTSFWELRAGLYLCWGVAIVVMLVRLTSWPALFAGIVVAVIGLYMFTPLGHRSVATGDKSVRREILAASRNFYGTLRVEAYYDDDPSYNKYVLVHGRTIHGFQYQAPEKRRMPTSYFGPSSGIGLTLANHPRRWPDMTGGGGIRIGVTGLGTGSLAAYGQAGDYIRFYEINPEIVRLARDSGYFTYLADCPSQWDIVPGDARISLERELQDGSQEFDLLVLDAFTSDAVPAHLLTREAFELYLKHLRTDGILAVNISNKVLDLRPVIWELADHFKLGVAWIPSSGDARKTTYDASWMLLTYDHSFLRLPDIALATTHEDDTRRVRLWTDDYHSLFPILR